MTLKDCLKKAQRQKFAIGQFNFSTIEQLKGILAAAQKTRVPVILGTSEGESKFLGLREIIALVEISKMKYKVSAFLNLDHGKDLNWLKKAIDFGYSAVHFDGSGLAFKENVKRAKKIVDYAHKRGVLVEGEIEAIKEKNLTSSVQAEKFVKETKVDSLAVAIGNIHGLYTGMPKLNLGRLKEINKKTNAYLVLHGGSGIPDVQIKKTIKLGIAKININTELRLTWKRALTRSLKAQEIKPYKILPKVQKAIQKKVEEKIGIYLANAR
ncbi:class II fructose-bisphosphate aldolase family protein [Patescibacteria group bacterium]|nr:class II fructose-bisphosphate aldolase family protein [Patescibacteria group bacterium]